MWEERQPPPPANPWWSEGTQRLASSCLLPVGTLIDDLLSLTSCGMWTRAYHAGSQLPHLFPHLHASFFVPSNLSSWIQCKAELSLSSLLAAIGLGFEDVPLPGASAGRSSEVLSH